MKMPHWPIPLGNKPIDLDLSRIRQVLQNLDNPQEKLPPVVHIAGTNGKGSTLAFLTAILQAAGYKVHRYTSPHLMAFNERIMLADTMISDNYLHEIAEDTRAATGDIPVTFFEGTTAMAFLAFSRIEADIVLLETGLGGRLDATNVVTRPALTAITPISLDHTEYLGPTVQTIAREKAGIMKQNSPCIIGYQSEDAMETLEDISGEIGVPLFRYGHEWHVERLPDNRLRYMEDDGGLDFSAPNLKGAHQYLNAAMALAISRCLDDFGFEIDEVAMEKGITSAKWPARLEPITSGLLAKNLPSGWEIWLDGAHNEAGSQMLSYMADEWQDRPLYAILGMTKGRNVEQFLQPLKGKLTHVCGVRVESEPSAISAENVAESARKAGFEASAWGSLEEAYNCILSLEKSPARILICGSLYLAGDVKLYNEVA